METETRPVYPTYSRGRTSSVFFSHRHCYRVAHDKPRYNINYRAQQRGVGIANLPYIPLTHVQDRNKSYLPEGQKKPHTEQKSYEYFINYIKDQKKYYNEFKTTVDDQTDEIKQVKELDRYFRTKIRSEIEDLAKKTQGMHNHIRYTAYTIDRMVDKYNKIN